MSTKVRDRKESPIEFLEIGRKLCAHTIRYAKNLPKSCRLFLANRICETALSVYSHLILANTYFPSEEYNITERKKHLKLAIGNLNVLDALISVALEEYRSCINEFGWMEWGRLITEEKKITLKLIKNLDTLNKDELK